MRNHFFFLSQGTFFNFPDKIDGIRRQPSWAAALIIKKLKFLTFDARVIFLGRLQQYSEIFYGLLKFFTCSYEEIFLLCV